MVLLDNVYSSLKLQPGQSVYLNTVKNPFEQIANTLVLKSAIGLNVSMVENSPMIKQFLAGAFTATYNHMPPRFELKQLTDSSENKVITIMQNIIDMANINNEIGSIGVNYEMFLENSNLKIQDLLLKDKLSREFSGLNITTVCSLDENTTLNLTIASAIDDNGKNGIYFQANFDNTVAGQNSIEAIFKKDYIKIAKEKIGLILN